jgi:hypothetical protein
MQNENAPEIATRFERVTCSRCGGSGSYSYCQRYGSTCFKCAGKKEVLTKRGAAAALYMNNLLSRPYAEAKVGDTIRCSGVTVGGGVYSYWGKIVEIERGIQRGASSDPVTGEMIPYEHETVTFVTESKRFGRSAYTMFASSLDQTVRFAASAEEKQAALAAALAYQATLTKTGTPRKRALAFAEAA